MQLSRSIEKLLYQHECVTIPQFGAFLTRSFGAKIDYKGLFYPPRKEVNFNQLLLANDGVLAHFIAQKENISYESALRNIEKEVRNWRKRLLTQNLLFPGLGKVQLNQDKKIQFIPLDKVNFELKSFGLYTYERRLILKTLNKSNPDDIMDDTTNDNLMFTPEQKENEKKSTIFRYAAIGLVGIVLVGASYFFGDRYVTEQRVVEQEKAQKQIEINVQEATFDIGSLNSVNISVSTSQVKEVVLDQIYFSIIAGSFRSIKNAENKVAVLEAEGYPAALAKVNPDGLYRVAYGRYNSKKEAINMLYFLKYTLEEEAWYLEER
jgi:hypothetical protein